MPRRLALSIAAVLMLALAGCGDAPWLSLDRPDPRLMTGQSAVVMMRPQLRCDEPDAPTVTLAGGAPIPEWLSVRVRRLHDGYYLGNPTSEGPFAGAGDDSPPPPPPAPPTTGGVIYAPDPGPGGYLCPGPTCRTSGFELLLTAFAGSPAGGVPLRIADSGCGRAASATLSAEVVGDAALGAFCGWSTGAGCAADAECGRLGCGGQVCGALGDTGACPDFACADPVPTGATCGCTAGTCAWR